MQSYKLVGQTLVVSVAGELDLHTGPALKTFVDDQLAANPSIKHIVFEVDRLTFIDSSGLGVILGRYRVIEQRGGRLFLVKPSPQIQRVLELSGIPKIATFAKTTREALEKV